MITKYNFLLENRFSFIKEELFDGDYKAKKVHDIMDHELTKLSDDHKYFKHLEKLCNKLYPKIEIYPRRFYPVRMFRRGMYDSCDYVVEFAFGLNGGTPKNIEFDDKWIYYLGQIKNVMSHMSKCGYIRPRMVWLEDPDHSDVYSCYITFKRKESKKKVVTEAFIHDYWKNTFGEFKFLFDGNNVNEMFSKVRKLNYRCHYISKTHGRISSIYYISPDKTKLIRISNHWSMSNIKGVKECNYIGNCYWILNSDKKIITTKPWQAGEIEMIKLRHI